MSRNEASIEFPSTRWLLVARAGDASEAVRREAQGQLLARYMLPMRNYLVRGWRLPPEKADDLLQGFVVSKVLEKNLFAAADPDRGKFRTFLLAVLNWFVASELRREGKGTRGGGERADSLEDLAASPIQAGQPDLLFDLDWARQVVDEAVNRMRRACAEAGRADLWGVFEARILAPALDGEPPVAYRELVARHAIASPEQASNLMISGKRMFLRTLRSVVGEYAAEDDIGAEIMDLRAALALIHQRPAGPR